MPLPVARSGNPKVYLPGYRSLSYGGFDAAMSSLTRAANEGTVSVPKFDAGQIAAIDKTGLQFNANQLISLGIKQPAYAVEAPLRPLDVATGGLVSDIAKGVSDTVSKIPVLSNIIGAAGEGLQFLDNVGASLPNHQLADWLSQSIGKPDDYVVVRHENMTLTAGQIRSRAQEQWAFDQKGNPFTLQELEARAKSDPWSFGEFATNADPGMDMINRLITNPLNLLFIPGLAAGGVRATAAGAKYLADASHAAQWARPVVKAVSSATPFRYGYGYATALGRGTGAFLKEAHNPTPLAKEFLDVNSGATAIMNGNLRGAGTMKSLLTATSWMARGARAIYLPGINTELRGVRLAGSAARAWMRGGIQQELVGAGAEYLFGGIDNYLQENGMDHTVIGGVTSAIHDALSEVMNDHPISDNNAFVMATLFLPWSGAAKDIVGPITNKFREARLPAYGNNVAAQIREKLNNRMGTAFKSNDEFFTALGKGDIQKGKDMFLWWIDSTEVLKAKNQFSHFLQQVASAEIDGLATLSNFFGENIRTNIERRRITGALKPGSTADYMFENHFNPGVAPKGATELASEVSGTAESFMREIQNLYEARLAIGPQLESLGLDIATGGILDRERMDAIIESVRLAPEGQISQDFARQIIDMGPSLVYDNEFWRQFAVTLGQEAHGGVTRKIATAAENVTRDDLIARLTEVRDKLPSQQELFHEVLKASKAQGVAKNDVFRIRETPYPLGEKVKANRLKAVTRVEQLADNERTLHTMRSNEYFKSGKPKFSTAAEIAGSDGGVFKRTEGGSYMRDDGVHVWIEKGVIHMGGVEETERSLVAQLDKTIFKSGPRKGTIKPGMEEQSAKLNLKIEAVRMGIDTEALLLAAQNVGRIFVADTKAGDLLASYGFVESARIGGTDRAAYSFRGGDASKILENRAANAFAPYRPSKRIVSERGAIGVARRDAINASLYVNATHYIGRSSNPTRTLFPEERLRYIKEQAEAVKDAYTQELKGVAAIDEIAFDMLPFDKKITDMNLQDWADALSTKEYGKVRDFFRDSYSQYPNLTLKRREPGMVVDPAQSRFTTLVTTKNRWQQMFMDYGPLSPIQRFYDALLAPVSVRWLGKQTQTEVHNLLATVGWEPNASREFIAKLRARVLESRSVRGVASITGSHTFRSVEALPEETLRAIAREISPEHAQAVLDRWGDYQKMLTEASNRLLRSVQRKTRMGGKLNPIEQAADTAFRFYQYAPGVSKVSFSGQRLTKFVYPWFRFHSDPFFHLMNFTEPSMYAILNNGWRGLQRPSEGIPRRMELSSAGLIPPGGLYAKDAPADLLLADAGTYTAPHNILPRLQREYELTTDKMAVELFDRMVKDHPVAVMMRERFGDNIPDWAAEMNRLMENIVKKPDDMVRAEWSKTLEQELGYTHAELKQLAPIAERLTEIYRGVHNDLTDLYIGRMNRPNLERLANTFFLGFPISYMIKVTSWMYKILFEKLGPVPGSAGAYLWDQYRQKYEKALDDPEFSKWTQDNADFIFALEMTMPVTPASVGINLNKTTRYVGSWLSQEWLGTPGPGEFDFPALLDNATRMGPLRTLALGGRLMKDWHVPGFYHPKPTKLKEMTPF